MKTKNKKILTRLLAVLATCLLLVALAVPCFADETDDTQYVLTKITYTTYEDLYDYIVQNYAFMSHIVLRGESFNGILYPTINGVFADNEIYVFSNHGFFGDYDTQTYMIMDLSMAFTSDSVGVTTVAGISSSSLNSVVDEVSAEDFGLFGAEVYAYVPAELTPVPIDPDAPTRTGLYGELYHIIRDAIYGENAFLDSTQEFTLTQIATWMTYIVILLPLVVIAIILFKIFVR